MQLFLYNCNVIKSTYIAQYTVQTVARALNTVNVHVVTNKMTVQKETI